MRYKLTIAYDGTDYAGWQIQKNGPSIQALIQQALQTVLRHPLGLSGSGRTDAGVHALGQTAHFDSDVSFNPTALRRSLNALLPETIRILSIDSVADDFHARYSATSKIYHYHVQLDPIFSPFERLYRWQPPFRIDLPRLRALASGCIGKRDFRSFSNRKDDDTVRHLMRLDIVEQEGGIRLEYEGDGFLYKMVRNLTGTLLAYSAEKGQEELEKVFAARDRRAAGAAAPAQGLFLIQVIYPFHLKGTQIKI